MNLRDAPIIIDTPGKYLTRTGLTVLINDIADPEKSTFNCKGYICTPAKKEGGRERREYNSWHPSGSYISSGVSLFDVVEKVKVRTRISKTKTPKQLRDVLTEAYLDWRNNYLSVEKWAEHNGLTLEQANKLLLLAREVFDSKHPDA